MKLRIPGKTFLVGEYSVLVGGNALGMATSPYFESNGALGEAHPESAAGLLLDQNEKYSLLHNSCAYGGFGLSTAEFIAVWFQKNKIKKMVPEQLLKIFSTYRGLFDQSSDLKKIKPSGADLIVQLLGGITYFDHEVFKSETLSWPFPNIGFDILATGLKIPTHQHLNQLDLSTLQDLPLHSELVIQAFKTQNEAEFFSSLRSWVSVLRKKGLQHNSSQELISKIEKCSEIILAKPNGALGADTITVFYQIENQKQVRSFLEHLNVPRVAGRDDLAEGAAYVD